MIVIEPDAETKRLRRGAALGIGALVLSLITTFWALILWAVGFGVLEAGAAYGIAITFFALCGFVGLSFFAFTIVVGTIALFRNAQVGIVCASVAIVVALGALTGGILVAVSLR